MNSSGSALEENAKWMESIEGKSTQLTNSMQTMWNSTLNSDVIKYFLDVGNTLVKVVDSFGLMKSVLAGVIVYFAAFKKITPASLLKDLSTYTKSYAATMQQVQQVKSLNLGLDSANMLNAANVNAYAAAVSNLSAKQQAAILSSAGLEKAHIAQILAQNGVEDATIRQILGLEALNATKTKSVALTGAEMRAELQNKGVKLSAVTVKWLDANATKNLTKEMVINAASQLKAKGATDAEIAALYNLAGASGTASVGVKGLGAAFATMIKANPLGLILTLVSALTMFAPLISGLFKSAEEEIQELQQEFNELNNTINDAVNNFRSIRSSAEEVIPRFAELAKGVDKFGKNVSLTDEEYKEFWDLNNKIAEMFPEINMGMDTNGNAILSLSLAADTLTDSLWALIDAERAAANEEIAKTMPDVLTNIYDSTQQYKNQIEDVEDQIDELGSAYDKLLSMVNGETEITFSRAGLDTSKPEILDLFDKMGVSYTTKMTGTNAHGDVIHYKVVLDPSMDKNEILRNYQNLLAGLENKIQSINDKIASKWQALNPIITAWTQTNYTYQGLSDGMKKLADAMIGSLDFSALGLRTQQDVENYINNNILNEIQSYGPKTQEAFSQLMSLDPKNLSVQQYLDEIDRLAREIDGFSSSLSWQDVLKMTGYDEIVKEYEDLVFKIRDTLAESMPDGMNMTDELDKIQKKLYSFSPEKLTKAFDIIKKYGIKTWDELVEALENKTFDVVIDYDAESAGIEALYKAIDESTSALGLSAESIKTLQNRYQDLENYDPARLFEKTENGIHLNVQALRELEAEYEKQHKAGLDKKLEGLTEHYNKLTKQIDECSSASEAADLYAQRDNILDQIKDTSQLAAQYAALTSNYYKWQKAQEGGNERDMYEGIISGRKDMDELMSRGWVDDEVRAYVDLLSSADLSTASIDEVLEAYKELNKVIGDTGYTIFDFFTVNDDGEATTDGLFNFFDTVKSVLGETYAWIDGNGKYHFDFGIGGDQQIADALGMDVEAVQALIRAMSDAGFVVNLDSMYSALGYLKTNAEEANDTLKELGRTTMTFNFNANDTDYLETQITEAKRILDTFKNEDGTINLETKGAVEAQGMLATLLARKQQLTDNPAILQIDVSGVTEASSEIDQAVQLLQNFKKTYQEYEIQLAIGADTTETQKKLDSLLAQMQGNTIVTGDFQIDPTSIDTAVKGVNAITPEMITNVLPDDTAIKNYDPNEEAKNALVQYGIDPESEVFRWSPPDKKGTIYYTAASTLGGYIWDKLWGGNGNDNAVQVNGTAHANGSWGAPKTETALTGELGPELLVRGNRWTTVGDKGAEFTQIKKGDIIFNHKQTESLLKHGYVTSRGKAYASGTAYSVSTDGVGRNTIVSAHIAGGGASRLEEDLNKAGSAASEFAEALDFIEIRLEELDESLGKLNAALENASDYASKNKIIDQMISTNREKLSNVKHGSDYYANYAAKYLSQIPAAFKEMAANGAIHIEDFAGEADEKIVEAITKYRDYIQKAADLKQQEEEIVTEIRELYVSQLDNAQHSGEVKATIEDKQTEKLQNAVDFDETRGLITDPNYYAAMMENSRMKMSYLTSARDNMQAAFDKAVADGQLEVGGDRWYEELEKLYQADAEITAAKMELEEFQNAINDIYWDSFDELMNNFDNISEETQNLIDLMSNSDMVYKPDSENGWSADEVEWTKEGVAALGLHAQEMERAEEKAKAYAIAIQDLAAEYEAGHYSESEYNEKLSELTKGQYDAIQAAKKEKDAIVDLNKERIEAVKEGLDKQVEAYEKLIEKQKESLDSQKDLYDFQKQAAEQSKNIADIERKLAALASDNSMAAVAKRKQLEAELSEARAEQEEMYYDRSIENQQNALDKDLENFKAEKEAEIEQMEKWLEDIEAVVTESLGIVQANAEEIGNTLTAKASEYSLTVSDAVLSPWKDGSVAISEYTTLFGDSVSSTTEQLETMRAKWQEIKEELAAANAEADKYYNKDMATASGPSVGDINKENAAYIDVQKKPEPPKQPDPPKTEPKAAPSVGSSVTVKKSATHFGSKSKNAKMASFVPGGSYTVYQVAGDQILIGRKGVYTGWVNKKDLEGYSKGSLGVDEDQFAWLDELGEELQLVPGANGRLEYVKKGTGIIPANLTERLMDLAMNPQEVLDRNRPQILPSKSIVNNNMELSVDASVGTLLHVEHLDGSNPEEVIKIVDKAWEKKMQTLNGAIKRFTR